MLILGIETSGHTGSIALWEAGKLVQERSLSHLGRRHAQALTAELEILCQDAKRTPAECQGIAVSVGPGSFTGLRIGVVCAKTFAYAVGCQVAAVDTLAAIAEECPAELDRLFVIADAQRGDLYAGQYRQENSRWIREGTLAIEPAQTWCRSRSSEDIIAGPGIARWQAEFPAECRLIKEPAVPKAATICELGERQLLAGKATDLWGLEPLYLRKSSAEEQWDLRHPT